MNTATRTSSLQAYTMLLHRKAVHPEFFGIESRRQLVHGEVDVEAWIFRGGHAVRFQHATVASASSSKPTSAAGTAARSVRASAGSTATGHAMGGASSASQARSTVGTPDPATTCICEVVTEQPDPLLDASLLASFPCAGERDHEERLSDAALYMTTIQTETLSEHLYVGTYKEMMQHVRESNSLFVAWTDEAGRPNLSLLDLQRYRNEVHLQAYHLRSDCGLVLRTQSMFQVELAKPAASSRRSGRS